MSWKQIIGFIAFAALLWGGMVEVDRATFHTAPVSAQTYAYSQKAYINTAATTAVRDGAGMLNGIVINGGTAGVVTLYDIGVGGCTGTPASGKFATIETIGSTNPVSLTYNVRVTTGLCVVTAAATDLTVAYN